MNDRGKKLRDVHVNLHDGRLVYTRPETERAVESSTEQLIKDAISHILNGENIKQSVNHLLNLTDNNDDAAHVVVQENGITALTELVDNAKNINDDEIGNVAQVLLHIAFAHADKFPSASFDALIKFAGNGTSEQKRRAANVLWFIASVAAVDYDNLHSIATQIVKKDGINPLVNIIGSDAMAVKMGALGVIRLLATTSNEIRRAIVDANGIPGLVTLGYFQQKQYKPNQSTEYIAYYKTLKIYAKQALNYLCLSSVPRISLENAALFNVKITMRIIAEVDKQAYERGGKKNRVRRTIALFTNLPNIARKKFINTFFATKEASEERNYSIDVLSDTTKLMTDVEKQTGKGEREEQRAADAADEATTVMEDAMTAAEAVQPNSDLVRGKDRPPSVRGTRKVVAALPLAQQLPSISMYQSSPQSSLQVDIDQAEADKMQTNINILTSDSDDDKVLESVKRIKGFADKSNAHKSAFANSNGIDALVNLISRTPTKEGWVSNSIKETAVLVLHDIVNNFDTRGKALTAIANTSGIKSLIALLSTEYNVTVVKLLHRLSDHNMDNAVAIVNANGIPPLLQLVNDNVKDDKYSLTAIHKRDAAERAAGVFLALARSIRKLSLADQGIIIPSVITKVKVALGRIKNDGELPGTEMAQNIATKAITEFDKLLPVPTVLTA